MPVRSVVQREDMVAVPALKAIWLTQPKFLRRADHHRRLGVADEVGHLGRLVGGVQRQEHMAGAQRGQVQHQQPRPTSPPAPRPGCRRAGPASPAGWRCARWRGPGRARCRCWVSGPSAGWMARLSRSVGKAARRALTSISGPIFAPRQKQPDLRLSEYE
jgi:hypothetical protein